MPGLGWIFAPLIKRMSFKQLLLFEALIVILGIIVSVWWVQDYLNCMTLLNAGIESRCGVELLNLGLLVLVSLSMVAVFFVAIGLKTLLFGKRKRR